MKKILILLLLAVPLSLFSQYLSKLNATKDDPLFTTYAAPQSRSAYKLDQGYQFQWFDPENGIEMISKDGPNLGLAIKAGNRLRFRLNELYREPVVTISYSDLFRYFYYPFPDIRIDVTFLVYSSGQSITCYTITNTGQSVIETGILPYLYFPSKEAAEDIHPSGLSGSYTFQLSKPRDGWMIEHDIPLTEKIHGYFTSTLSFDSTSAFLLNPADRVPVSGKEPYSAVKSSISVVRQGSMVKGLIGSRTIRIAPQESVNFRITIGLFSGKQHLSAIQKMVNTALAVDPEKLIRDDEVAYARIPKLKFTDPDKEMLYWSSFSLMRQCMMPPEGKCSQNYYVFSREPKWGWGYGGQVFHESLCMMAYALMDPQGAMNSQRVYMDRQKKNGYINYRTGPYLDETIETNGQLTTSAPWFNYENLEIFKITGDRKFLKDAYLSGRKFYQYYVDSRDSNANGLCEWGAHAELESVRDARVDVWDNVGWASNFEGPDVNSLLVKEARSLQEMARILGNSEEELKWKKDADHRSDLINVKLWDSETGFYYNVDKTGQSFSFHQKDDLKIKEIIGFLPLWAGITDPSKTRLLVNKLTDTSEFWRPYGIPSLTAKSSYYCPIGYWNGPVWVQWNYLLFRGLLENGYKNEARMLSDRVIRNIIFHLKKDHVFWEFYSADETQAGWNKTYIWAGIAARFLTDLDDR